MRHKQFGMIGLTIASASSFYLLKLFQAGLDIVMTDDVFVPIRGGTIMAIDE
jgi:hypothetical protein